MTVDAQKLGGFLVVLAVVHNDGLFNEGQPGCRLRMLGD